MPGEMIIAHLHMIINLRVCSHLAIMMTMSQVAFEKGSEKFMSCQHLLAVIAIHNFNVSHNVCPLMEDSLIWWRLPLAEWS